MTLQTLIIILSMIAVNAVFAACEIALAAITPARLQTLVRENRRGAKAALYLKEHMEVSFAALQIGINLVGAIAAACGGVGAEAAVAPWLRERFGLPENIASAISLIVVVVPLTLVTILVGELAPKVYAVRNKEVVCLRSAAFVWWLLVFTWPAVWLLDRIVRRLVHWGERLAPRANDAPRSPEAALLQELRAQATYARASRLIGEREETIILSAARLSARPVREIMLPAEHISMLDVNESFANSLVAAHLDMHTRFPVTERAGDPQAILGYVNFKDIVALMRLSHPHRLSLRNIVRTLPNLRDDMPISAGMERMIHEHSHIALVRGADKRVVGMVTLEDILEELVGDIQDEYDRLPTHVVRSGRAWVVGGGMNIQRLAETTGIDLNGPAPNPPRTVHDWIASELGRPARGGDVVERHGARVLVRKVRRQKVLEAQISSAGPDEEGEEE